VTFNKDSLKIDAAAIADRVCETLKSQIFRRLRKGGAVVGVSGGLDSSVVAALCTRALGAPRVLGVIMPETESSPASAKLAQALADSCGFETVTEDISLSLSGLNCYRRRVDAIKQVFPQFHEGQKAKITIPGNILDKDTFNYFNLTIEDETGKTWTKRMPLRAYLEIVAATNLKQRLRMTAVYYHAERRNWAVVGTGNKDEYQQGFFVKYGDGGVDLQPIVHLYKIQVYQLGQYLGIPEKILERKPTTDTYYADVSQEEFFYGLDFYRMDMLSYAMEKGVKAGVAAAVLGITEEQAERAYRNIRRKMTATKYLRSSPLGADS
jgi:NAD+ synthase